MDDANGFIFSELICNMILQVMSEGFFDILIFSWNFTNSGQQFMLFFGKKLFFGHIFFIFTFINKSLWHNLELNERILKLKEFLFYHY
jgi:phosphotransferase system  glucose/maltose/N-acetylglucosamine-specific IIC component